MSAEPTTTAINVATDPVYADWRAELAGGARTAPVNVAPLGYYRFRSAAGMMPLAVYDEPGVGPVYKIGPDDDREVDPAFCERVFSRAKAVSVEDYWHRINSGSWPDEVRVPAPKPAAAPADEITANPDNPHADQRNSTDDLVIKDQIAELLREEAAWIKLIGGAITTQDQADRQVGFRDAFLALQSSAEKARTAEKKPHLDAGRDVDKRWKPVVDKANWAKIDAEARPQAFLKAERARLLAEATAAAAADQPVRDLKVKAGTSGRGIALKEPKQIVIVEDLAALRTHMATLDGFWLDRDVAAAVTRLALAQMRSGVGVPGARLGTEQTT